MTHEEALAIVRAARLHKYMDWDDETDMPHWSTRYVDEPSIVLDDDFTLDELKAIVYLQEHHA